MKIGTTEEEYLILIIDHDFKKYYNELVDGLKKCEPVFISDRRKACDFFSQNKVDVVLLAHNENFQCIKTLKFFKSAKPSVPVIIITASGSEELAVTVFRCGAKDYFRLPLDLDEFKTSVKAALNKREAKKRRKSDYCFDCFRTAVQHINDNYNQRMRLSNIAKEAGMSVSCFERTFKRKMGVTFTVYVNNFRISKSIKMIEVDHFSTNEIAYACGFTNQFHFSRMFKRIMNVPPSQYRKSLKN